MSDPAEAQHFVDLHLENLCDFDERGRMRAEPADATRRPPRFRMVLTANGSRWFVRDDLDDGLVEQLEALAVGEPMGEAIPEWPQHRARYVELLGADAEAEYCGPAYVLPERDWPPGPAIELSEEDRPLLERHLSGWARDFEASRPIGAVVEDGAAVSVCGNARRLSPGVEAGVETVETYRRRGYARAATAVWAQAIRREGMIPLYSTSWDNIASQRIAASLGAVQYAVDYTLQ
jgi:RimJ/RimL family protein N-acetyltransferase